MDLLKVTQQVKARTNSKTYDTTCHLPKSPALSSLCVEMVHRPFLSLGR